MKKLYFILLCLGLFSGIGTQKTFAQQWSFKAPMSVNRAFAASAVCNGKIYVIGGVSENVLTSLNERFDPVSNTWETLAPMPTSRAEFDIACVNGKIYAIGGSGNSIGGPLNNGTLNSVEEYNPITNTWTTRSPMPTWRSNVSLAVINDLIYCSGGWPYSIAVCEVYNPATDQWITASPLNTGRVNTNGSASLQGFGYFIGGKNEGGVLNSCERYNPSENSWTYIPSLPEARWAGAAVGHNNKVCLLGGSVTTNYFPSNSFFAYQPESNQWTQELSMQVPRCNFSAVSFNNKIYVFGGTTSSAAYNFVNSVEEYSSGNETSLSYQLSQEKLGNCATSPVKLSVQTSVKLKTDSAGSIGSSSATAYGNILNDGGKTITRRGFCWGTSANPTLSNSFSENGSGSGTFSGSLSALSPSTTYYLRAYAGTATEVWYGNELSFTTSSSTTSATCGTPNIHNPNLSYGSMSDQDGNSYKTIVIGTQEWMAENLKTGHYRNGEVIPVVTNDTAWRQLGTGASCWYNNDSTANDCPYGRLYNWYTVADPRGLCPAGWHVPGDGEWTVLQDFLGGNSIASKMMSVSNWQYTTSSPTNESGFSALPGGDRNSSGSFCRSYFGIWWTSTTEAPAFQWSRFLQSYSNELQELNNYTPNSGLSIRCLKSAAEAGSINSLDCGGAVNTGSLHARQAASGVRTTIAYTGGNGGGFSSRVIASTGITGLTATLSAGNFANGNGSLSFIISGTPATNGIAGFALSIGGQNCSFTYLVAASGGGVTDIDGNTYGSVIIGNQEWMSENLKVSKYRNHDLIIGGYSWSSHCTGYGSNFQGLQSGTNYNWYAVSDPRGLCPEGWHAPTDAEWTNLENFLGGPSVAGGHLKSTSLLWLPPNAGANNSSGFSALPGPIFMDGLIGGGGSCGPYDDRLSIGYWWSSSDYNYTTEFCGQSWARSLDSYSANSSQIQVEKDNGIAIRCLKDAPETGSINSLDCGEAVNSGTLSAGQAASGATTTISYTGGNGGNYSSRVITSTGVTGLTALLAAGSFTNGDGSLSLSIIGTPASSGTASFALSIGGQTCTLTRFVELPFGTITALSCSTANNSGTLTQGVAAANVSSSVPYTGANGGTYTAQTITSTGVTGLTATLEAGNFANGNGSLSFIISGMPESSGIASFALSIGGQTCSFTVEVFYTITDLDGNIYNTVSIGNQVWMKENLRVSKYKNGEEIPTGLDNSAWQSTTDGAFSEYDNPTNNVDFGRLYNWYAVVDSRGLCPNGWHIPSDDDWFQLSKYLDPLTDTICLNCVSSTLAGGKMKANSTLWSSPNSNASNSSGFTGLPGGIRYFIGINGNQFIGFNGSWWSSTEISSTPVRRTLGYADGNLYRGTDSKKAGISVRCLKD